MIDTTSRFCRKNLALVLIMSMMANWGINAKTLAVPTVSQLPQTNWCWAASSQAVLSYTGGAPGMCAIANWAREQNKWGNDDCCTNGTGAICNQPNSMWGGAGSIKNILDNYGAKNTETFGRSLTLKESTDFVDDDSIVIVRWGWSDGRGHFVVLHGYNGSAMDIMDPWNGSSITQFSKVVNPTGGTWTHTLAVKPQKLTFVVDDTGSMWDDIDSVRSTLHNKIKDLKADKNFTKYTLITYKDDVSVRGSTIDHDEIDNWVSGLGADGGDDCPEEGYGALDVSAEKAKNSEVWWMTDADSHGGFLRMLATQARLLLAGNTLHSTILGSCSGGSAASKVVLTSDSGKAPARSSQENSISYTGIFPITSKLQSRLPHLTSDSDLNAYTAGEELSDKTGGLYFAVNGSTIQGATEAILEETSSTALIKRLKLPAGNHEIAIPVDQSNGIVKFLINIPTGGVGTLAVKDPEGKELKSGMEGVEEIVAGDSRMLILNPPALKAGVFTASSSSDTEYLLSVSSLSDFGALLVGDTTAGVDKILPIQLSIPGLLPLTGLGGPGPDGPGGVMPPVVIPPVPSPFLTSNLRFFVIGEDGSDQGGLALYDDGKHDDKLPGDGVYGGSWLAPKSLGSFRIAVSDGGNYYRVTKLIVTAGTVSVQGPADPVAAPGTTINHTLTVQNLGSGTRSFDLVATTSAGWESMCTLVKPI